MTARMIHGIDLYAAGGLDALFAFHRARFGDLRMEADGGASGDTGDAGDASDADGAGGNADGSRDGSADGPKVGPNGFPEKTPWRAMAPEHQVAYHLFHSRKHEEALKAERARNADLAAKAQQFDALDEASKSEAQREIDRLTRELEQARSQQQEARRTFGTQLVETRLSAAAAAKGMTPEALNTLAGDLGRFLADDGMDADAVDEFLAALPEKSVEAVRPGRIDLGGGRREPARVSGVDAGAELYNRTHKRRSSA